MHDATKPQGRKVQLTLGVSQDEYHQVLELMEKREFPSIASAARVIFRQGLAESAANKS
jgi:hypothetical protein